MSVEAPDLYKLISYIEDDLRGVHAKLTTLRSYLASMSLPAGKRNICPLCELEVRPPTSLADHQWRTHGVEVEA